MISPVAYISIAFFNVVAGAFTGKNTIAVYMALLSVLIIYASQNWLLSYATANSVDVDMVAVVYSALGSVMLWSPSWFGWVAKAFR